VGAIADAESDGVEILRVGLDLFELLRITQGERDLRACVGEDV
jgi:hypothetical protein